MVPRENARAGRLFLPASHADHTKQLVLPGFEQQRDHVALPLVLYDLGVKQAAVPGRGAPLALRLWIESILAVDLEQRGNDVPIAVRMTLRRLLAQLYPGRTPRPTEYWPRLVAATRALDSYDARIPWEDPDTGQGGLRRIVSVSDIPRGAGHLDDLITMTVHLPPGTRTGPVVSPRLGQWGLRSAPAYRGLINLPLTWHEPGRTRIPIDRRPNAPQRERGQHWVWNPDPRLYPKLTDALVLDALYPTSSRRKRRNLVHQGHRVIRELADASELHVIDGHLLPPDARPQHDDSKK